MSEFLDALANDKVITTYHAKTIVGDLEELVKSIEKINLKKPRNAKKIIEKINIII